MSLFSIESLESFYLQALDAIKSQQARINAKNLQETRSLTRPHHKMWETLGIEPISQSEVSSSEEFIQTDASFYAARKNNEDTINLSMDS